jgi:hypothetical protein
MGEKKSKWQDHLKAAAQSGLSLRAYATLHQINVQRLYAAKHRGARKSSSAWAVVRVKPETAVEVVSKVKQCAAPSSVAMQARLGNGIVLSWTHEQRNADAPCSVLRTLAALPCSV